MNLFATIAQAAVYSIVSISVGLYYKRLIKRERDKLDRILNGVEAVFGITSTPDITVKETLMDTYARFKKGFAAGIGVVLIGTLVWLSNDGVLATLLEPIVPDMFKPLIGVLAGGIALVVAVVRSKNKPEPGVVEVAPVQAVRAYVPTNTAQTSIVSLLPAPEPSYF